MSRGPSASSILNKQTFYICALYGITSIAISLCYKVGAGLIFTSVAQATMQDIPGMHVPGFKWSTYIESIPVGALFVSNIAVGWYGMQLINVPFFLCLRRTTTILTMVGEFFLLGTKQSGMVVLSVLVIMAGTVIAGYEELGGEFTGYIFTMMNNVLSALYLIVSRRFSDMTDTKGFGLVYYNSITAVPLALVGAIVLGDFEKAASFEHIQNPLFWTAFVVASTLGTFMTYVVFLSATMNSPLLTSITGNLKDVFATVFGAIAFGDFVPTPLKIAGLAVSLLGGGAFAAVKLCEHGQQAEQLPSEAVGAEAAAGMRSLVDSAPITGSKVKPTVQAVTVAITKGSEAKSLAAEEEEDIEVGLLPEADQEKQQQTPEVSDIGSAS